MDVVRVEVHVGVEVVVLTSVGLQVGLEHAERCVQARPVLDVVRQGGVVVGDVLVLLDDLRRELQPDEPELVRPLGAVPSREVLPRLLDALLSFPANPLA